MTVSCADFTADITAALGVEAPDDTPDSDILNVELEIAIKEITRLQAAARLLSRATEYVEKFADLNDEPKNGDCRTLLEEMLQMRIDVAGRPPTTQQGRTKIWVVTTCIPEPGAEPCMPDLFTSEASAEQHADTMLRAEWASHTPYDDDGKPEAYPDNWREAQDRIAKWVGPEWGKWEITEHTLEHD
jgi:hypothetical protein